MGIQVGESSAPVGSILELILYLREPLSVDSDHSLPLGDRVDNSNWSFMVLMVHVARTILRLVMHLISSRLILWGGVHL